MSVHFPNYILSIYCITRYYSNYRTLFFSKSKSRKVAIQYIEYRRAIPPSPHFGNNCNYQDCRLIQNITYNIENSRHINRMYVERDHSLRMRCHERIDHAAVYQKCIKTNAETYRLEGYSHAYRTQPNRGIYMYRGKC